jgi:hypothetical protein
MKRKRVVAVVLGAAVGLGGVAVSAGPAAAEIPAGCTVQGLVWGAAQTHCTTRSHRAVAWCSNINVPGYRYYVYGPWKDKGQFSVAQCHSGSLLDQAQIDTYE